MTMMKPSYLSIQTPLDDDAAREHRFHIEHLAGEEGLGREFTYRVKVLSPERLSEEEVHRLVGTSVTVQIDYRDANGMLRSRFINGLVYELKELGLDRAPLMPDIWKYEIEISSWLRQLRSIKDFRIFQKNSQTAESIVTELLHEFGFTDVRSEIGHPLPLRKYVVMYNETVYDFITRLLGEEGIFWRFDFFENKHELIFCNDSILLPLIPDESITRVDRFTLFRRQDSFVPITDYTSASFDWQSPPVKTTTRPINPGNDHLRSYEYTADYQRRSEGRQQVEIWDRATKSEANSLSGESTIRVLAAGRRFTLMAPAIPELNEKTFLLKDLFLEATPIHYKNSFICQPDSVPFASHRKADKKPKVHGLQTATVVGEGVNGDVSVDQLGRVKVRFHWDYQSPKNASHTSADIRVAMPAAGVQRGFLFNPRIGEEVLVDFENGDPEKPVIIGSLYSKTNPPPFAPHSHPHKSIIKNASDKDSNQVMFDDKPGAEKLEIVAKKEMSIHVNRNMTVDVKKDINIESTATYILAKSGVSITAGNMINNMSLATILTIAGLLVNNSAGENILNAAAAIVFQGAGGKLENLAGTLIANTSAMGIKQRTEGVMENVSAALLSHLGMSVKEVGEDGVTNEAKLGIVSSASTALVKKGQTEKSKSLMSMSEAKKVNVQGKTTVGPA